MSPVFPLRDVRGGNVVAGTEANVVVVIRPVVVPIAVEHARIRCAAPVGRRESEQVGSVVLVAAVITELAGSRCIGAAGGVLDAASRALPANAAGRAAEHLIAAASEVRPAGRAAPREQPGFQVVLGGQVGRVAPRVVCAVPAVGQAGHGHACLEDVGVAVCLLRRIGGAGAGVGDAKHDLIQGAVEVGHAARLAVVRGLGKRSAAASLGLGAAAAVSSRGEGHARIVGVGKTAVVAALREIVGGVVPGAIGRVAAGLGVRQCQQGQC